jgi:hypothetical protein
MHASALRARDDLRGRAGARRCLALRDISSQKKRWVPLWDQVSIIDWR